MEKKGKIMSFLTTSLTPGQFAAGAQDAQRTAALLAQDQSLWAQRGHSRLFPQEEMCSPVSPDNQGEPLLVPSLSSSRLERSLGRNPPTIEAFVPTFSEERVQAELPPAGAPLAVSLRVGALNSTIDAPGAQTAPMQVGPDEVEQAVVPSPSDALVPDLGLRV